MQNLQHFTVYFRVIFKSKCSKAANTFFRYYNANLLNAKDAII